MAVGYKAISKNALYDEGMSMTGDLRVSSRGQMSLPASARKRWNIEDGGEIGFVDIGDAIVLVPGGTRRLRAQLLDAVEARDWADAHAGFGDPDLETQ